MGECSDEYVLFRAAKYIGCDPWELLKQPQVWMDWALDFMAAEAQAEKERNKRRK